MFISLALVELNLVCYVRTGLSLVVLSSGYSSCSVWASHCGRSSCCRTNGSQIIGMRNSEEIWRTKSLGPLGLQRKDQ